MAQIMSSTAVRCFSLLAWSCLLLGGAPATGSPQPPSASPPPGSFVTQTVYGFLDFTTTIGNTVMVFSPQSAAVPDASKDQTTQPPVIDTKPSTTIETQPHLTIKPTQTQNKPDKKTSEVFSVVNVQSNAPAAAPSSKVEIKSQAVSKFSIVEGVSSEVNSPPFVSSKIEVVGPEKSIATKVDEVVITGTSKLPPTSSTVEVYEGTSSIIIKSSQSKEDEEESAIIGNNIGEPEYEFLSRQPSEVVEETYKVINLKPSSKVNNLKPRSIADNKKTISQQQRGVSLHPTGLVTKLGGTIVKDSVTTVHETSVIGTYINGKYAQVLQSSSKIINPKGFKITPSPTLRILKTAAPSVIKANKYSALEPTPPASTAAFEEVSSLLPEISQKQSKKSGQQVGPFKPRAKNRPKEQEIEEATTTVPLFKKNKLKPTSATKFTSRQHTSTSPPPPPLRQFTSKSKFGGKTARHSVYSDPVATVTATTSRSYQSRKHNNKSKFTALPQPQEAENLGYSRKAFKPRSIQPTVAEQQQLTSHSSIYKFKLNRTPGRWQYTTTPKPKVNIKRIAIGGGENHHYNVSDALVSGSNDAVTHQSKSDDLDGLVASESIASIIDDESSTENKIDNPFPLETVKVEISTPPDFKDTYYEIATIKSPYTFQAGNVKKTRYVTITSTIEKLLEPSTIENQLAPTRSEPLTENILATGHNYEKDNNFLDSSIATLPPLYMASDMETPPLETKTETFSTTQTMLKTHILPAVRGGNQTSSYTLVQTYLVTRLVTATKTLPPMEAYHFVPSKILNEFNSHLDEAGSELNLELAFGDDNENESDGLLRKSFPADLDLANIGSDFNLSDVDKTNLVIENHLRAKKAHPFVTQKPPVEAAQTPSLSQEQLQQLALLRLLNPGPQHHQGQVVTTSKPVIKVETLYTSHILPLMNGQSTIFTTLSKVLGTVTKTDYEFGTSTLMPPQLPPQVPQVPQIPQVNPLFQQQFTVVTSPVVQTTVATATESKVLKLTFGAKTAYTTIFSTSVVPTVVTSYTTASVPVQPQLGGFPGFFPAPYQPFPYLG